MPPTPNHYHHQFKLTCHLSHRVILNTGAAGWRRGLQCHLWTASIVRWRLCGQTPGPTPPLCVNLLYVLRLLSSLAAGYLDLVPPSGTHSFILCRLEQERAELPLGSWRSPPTLTPILWVQLLSRSQAHFASTPSTSTLTPPQTQAPVQSGECGRALDTSVGCSFTTIHTYRCKFSGSDLYDWIISM